MRTGLIRTEIDGETYGAIEDDAGKDEICSFPVVVFQQHGRQRGEDEGTETGSTDGDAGGQSSSLFEVIADGDDGRQVDESKPDPADDAVGDHEHGHRVGEGRQGESGHADYTAHNTGCPAAEFVGEGADDGPATQVDAGQEGADPGHRSLAFVEVDDEFGKEDAESVGDSVHNEIAKEGRHDDHPSPSTVRRNRNIVYLFSLKNKKKILIHKTKRNAHRIEYTSQMSSPSHSGLAASGSALLASCLLSPVCFVRNAKEKNGLKVRTVRIRRECLF